MEVEGWQSWSGFLIHNRTFLSIGLLAAGLGIWHLVISIRCLLGRAPLITLAHHALHLFAPFALLILGSMAGPAIDSGVAIAPATLRAGSTSCSAIPPFSESSACGF
jgi:hypothetical protein